MVSIFSLPRTSRTSYFFAVSDNNAMKVAKLLKKPNIDINCKSVVSLNIVMTTITAKITVPNTPSDCIQSGDTLLIHAAFNGHVESATLLVEHGADVNIRGKVWHYMITSYTAIFYYQTFNFYVCVVLYRMVRRRCTGRPQTRTCLY